MRLTPARTPLAPAPGVSMSRGASPGCSPRPSPSAAPVAVAFVLAVSVAVRLAVVLVSEVRLAEVRLAEVEEERSVELDADDEGAADDQLLLADEGQELLVSDHVDEVVDDDSGEGEGDGEGEGEGEGDSELVDGSCHSEVDVEVGFSVEVEGSCHSDVDDVLSLSPPSPPSFPSCHHQVASRTPTLWSAKTLNRPRDRSMSPSVVQLASGGRGHSSTTMTSLTVMPLAWTVMNFQHWSDG